MQHFRKILQLESRLSYYQNVRGKIKVHLVVPLVVLPWAFLNIEENVKSKIFCAILNFLRRYYEVLLELFKYFKGKCKIPTEESEAICSLKQILYKSAGTIVEVYSEPSQTSKMELFTK